MAIVLQATYAKKIGLPQYSSHQFTVALQSEITELAQLPAESKRLHQLLQSAVDQAIQEPGWLPGGSPAPATPEPAREAWACSERQRELILRIVEENQLDRMQVDTLARQRFGVGVRELNRLQASGLIDELLEGQRTTQGRRRGRSRVPQAGRGVS